RDSLTLSKPFRPGRETFGRALLPRAGAPDRGLRAATSKPLANDDSPPTSNGWRLRRRGPRRAPRPEGSPLRPDGAARKRQAARAPPIARRGAGPPLLRARPQ